MEDNGYVFCWHRLQRISKKVCESRIEKGVCKTLDAPRPIGRDRQEFFNAEGETETCEEVNGKRQRISD